MSRANRDRKKKFFIFFRSLILVLSIFYFVLCIYFELLRKNDFVVKKELYNCSEFNCKVELIIEGGNDHSLPAIIRVTGVKAEWIGNAQVNKQLFSKLFHENVNGFKKVNINFNYKSLIKPDYLIIKVSRASKSEQ